ncbi:MAG: hypothetical protein M8353_03480 [ANME-2 cluster archaeon]|nr:hypothetical protein [ANME-2 cluster archaeon]
MNTQEDLINNISEAYQSNITTLKNGLVLSIKEGIHEGVDRGIENGVKEGILDGLDECFDMGFLTIKRTTPRELTEILKQVALDSMKEKVQQDCKDEICPVLETNIKNICKQIIKYIEDNEITIDEDIVEVAKINVEDMVKKNIREIEQYVTQHIPANNFLYNTIFEPLKKCLYQCLSEKYNNCTEQIEKSLTT